MESFPTPSCLHRQHSPSPFFVLLFSTTLNTICEPILLTAFVCCFPSSFILFLLLWLGCPFCRLKGRGSSLLWTHTWEDPEIYQLWTVKQANQNDCPKETWKKYLLKVIQTSTRVQPRDSPSESACLPAHIVLFFLLINTLLVSLLSILWEFFSAKPKGQRSGHRPLV